QPDAAVVPPLPALPFPAAPPPELAPPVAPLLGGPPPLPVEPPLSAAPPVPEPLAPAGARASEPQARRLAVPSATSAHRAKLTERVQAIGQVTRLHRRAKGAAFHCDLVRKTGEKKR